MIGYFDKVDKRIGKVDILRGISFKIGEGVTLIVGPNGSGKSTLIKLLVGFWRPTKGKVKLLGENPWNNYKLRQKVGISIDPPSLPKYRRGIDVVKIMADIKDVKIDNHLVKRLFPNMDALNRMIIEYSAGMRKRLSILLALLGENKVLVLDEPFSGIDVSGISEVSKIIKEEAEKGTNIVVVSHMWKPLYDTVDRVVVLVGGEIGFIGDKDEGIKFLNKWGF
ncbi:ATP-binding cassette domain-containing protein [Pyrococcus kukulkanii]|uniref:Transporter n=1 Tax=Pyrococcus kukulkanii TaxID=1609559 RepID=A0A127BBH3_9EURY|nr:ABC transporter ATP-binding protein [Pyrococcus kukulkanii]AMM54691.1 transporter [Pyrococcus kukulkanii]